MVETTKIKTARGWAIVSKRGKIKVDTVCVDRESAKDIFNQYDEMTGCKVVRVTVVYSP